MRPARETAAFMRIDLPDFPVAGGCQCGKVRYRLMAAPVVFYHCHCTECQTQSASAFGQSMRVQAEHLLVAGQVRTFLRPAAAGTELACDFCPECGVRLFHRRSQYAGRLNIKAGTLDDTSWLVPAGHIWVGSKQPGITLSENALTYRGQPEDGYAALEQQWQQMIAGN